MSHVRMPQALCAQSVGVCVCAYVCLCICTNARSNATPSTYVRAFAAARTCSVCFRQSTSPRKRVHNTERPGLPCTHCMCARICVAEWCPRVKSQNGGTHSHANKHTITHLHASARVTHTKWVVPPPMCASSAAICLITIRTVYTVRNVT